MQLQSKSPDHKDHLGHRQNQKPTGGIGSLWKNVSSRKQDAADLTKYNHGTLKKCNDKTRLLQSKQVNESPMYSENILRK